MPASSLKPTTIDEYILNFPPEIQARLLKINALVQKAAPGATPGLKWSMPAYSYDKILVTFMAFKNHIGFYPMPSAIEHFKKELKPFKTAKGSIQLPHDKPLPTALLTRIVRFRVKESKEGTLKWRS